MILQTSYVILKYWKVMDGYHDLYELNFLAVGLFLQTIANLKAIFLSKFSKMPFVYFYQSHLVQTTSQSQ